MGSQKTKRFYAARAILLGLLTTQIIATLHVYLSNADLYRMVMAVTEAGYFAIPNQRVMHTLREFGPAFFGGCFFTLSLGAGLSVLSVVCAWIWDQISGRNRYFLVLILFLWVGTVVAVNSQSFCPMATSYFLAVPLVVFTFTLKWMPEQRGKRLWLNRLVYFLPIAILTMIWTAHAGQFLFLDIRDYLLLSNPIGIKINNFYYRYTLYPAEIFKPLNKKTLKVCCLLQIKDKSVVRRIESVLINNDYLPVSTDVLVDLEILESKNRLIFKHRGKTVLQTTFNEFFLGPEKVLRHFSMKTERHAPFRQATIFCFLLGFPVTLYVMVFALLCFILGFFVGPTPSSMVTAAICLSMGLALLVPLHTGGIGMGNEIDLSEALNSECWQHRVAALRTVVRRRLEISNFQVYRRILASPHIPERYWLTQALGVSRHPQTYQDLLAFLDDPHPNVVSMAFHALGQRRDKRAVKEIVKRIKTSDYWYNQWYAYRALRRLGWRQSKKRL